jgi:GntR family transcriptional regulator
MQRDHPQPNPFQPAHGPKWREIANILREEIETGRRPVGSQLDPEMELSKKHNASRNTIREAMNWLVHRGLVVKLSGRGTFVRGQLPLFVNTLSIDPRTGFSGGEGVAYKAEVKGQGHTSHVDRPKIEVVTDPAHVAGLLNLDQKAKIIVRQQVRRINGQPNSLQTSYYPFEFVKQGAIGLLDNEDVESGIVAYLNKELGIEQAGYRDIIAARPRTKEESDALGFPDDAGVVVELTRTAFDKAGLPFRVTVTVYPADRNAFAINVGEVPEQAKVPAQRAERDPSAAPT